jgi:hypothetical protein
MTGSLIRKREKERNKKRERKWKTSAVHYKPIGGCL